MMVLTVEVPPEIEERLSRRAEARGLTLNEYIRELLGRETTGERPLRGYAAYRHLPHKLAEFERECCEEKLREDSL
jgi:hypothetical protein